MAPTHDGHQFIVPKKEIERGDFNEITNLLTCISDKTW